MPIGVSYMGTKRQLAPRVVDISDRCRKGPFLDIFSGMCSVGLEAAPKRNIWTNDCQHFAWSVAQSYFCSEAIPKKPSEAVELIYAEYVKQRDVLSNLQHDLLEKERRALDAASVEGFSRDAEMYVATDARGIGENSHHLFSRYFSGTYFGVYQSIEIDSIRCAIDQARTRDRLSVEQHRWLLLGLCRAVAKVATTTGHFAQPLKVKPPTLTRFKNQRARSVWTEWRSSLDVLYPVGSAHWRKGNRAFRDDALDNLSELISRNLRPGVIYADPPYTDDQYSRFYHLYETLLLYDYPALSGVGQYRPDRHVSAFSLASRVEEAIQTLVAKSAQLGSDLILSYPTNGLLEGSRERIPELLRGGFRFVEAVEVSHQHSTMGASKGAVSAAVTEVIYCARQ